MVRKCKNQAKGQVAVLVDNNYIVVALADNIWSLITFGAW